MSYKAWHGVRIRAWHFGTPRLTLIADGRALRRQHSVRIIHLLLIRSRGYFYLLFYSLLVIHVGCRGVMARDASRSPSLCGRGAVPVRVSCGLVRRNASVD